MEHSNCGQDSKALRDSWVPTNAPPALSHPHPRYPSSPQKQTKKRKQSGEALFNYFSLFLYHFFSFFSSLIFFQHIFSNVLGFISDSMYIDFAKFLISYFKRFSHWGCFLNCRQNSHLFQLFELSTRDCVFLSP